MGLVIGNLIDSGGKGISLATVQLISMSDTGLNRGSMTDKNGGFEISNIPFGYYRLKFSSVGYNELVVDSI